VLVSVGGKRWWEKGVRGWIWYKYYKHIYVNAKMILLKVFQECGEGGK
jgi:hypothetical protein